MSHTAKKFAEMMKNKVSQSSIASQIPQSQTQPNVRSIQSSFQLQIETSLFVKFQSSTPEERKILLKENTGLRQFISKALEDKKKKELSIQTRQQIPYERIETNNTMTSNQVKPGNDKVLDTSKEKKKRNHKSTLDSDEVPELMFEKKPGDTIHIEIDMNKFLKKTLLKEEIERITKQNGVKLDTSEIYVCFCEEMSSVLATELEDMIKSSIEKRAKFVEKTVVLGRRMVPEPNDLMNIEDNRAGAVDNDKKRKEMENREFPSKKK